MSAIGRVGMSQLRSLLVMPGHSRPKDGVAPLAYVPGIPIVVALCLNKRDGRDKPGHDHLMRLRLGEQTCRLDLHAGTHGRRDRHAIDEVPLGALRPRFLHRIGEGADILDDLLFRE